MKNTKKLNLNDLKVDSYVTSLDVHNSQTVKGGSTEACAVSASVIVAAVAAAVSYFVSGIVVKKEMDKIEKAKEDAPKKTCDALNNK